MSSLASSAPVPAGTVVEFFEARQILLGVALAMKGSRLSVLGENGREFNLARSRVLHFSRGCLNCELGRDFMIAELAKIRNAREDLTRQIDIEELWSLLMDEAQSFSAEDLAELVFSEAINDHHVAAVQRVLLQDKLYFQFKDGSFRARPETKVQARTEQLAREAERDALLSRGSDWLAGLRTRQSAHSTAPEPDLNLRKRIVESLKNFALHGQEAPDQAFVKELLKRANLKPEPQTAFHLLVRLGVWHEDENTYLLQQDIPIDFPERVEHQASDYLLQAPEKLAVAADSGLEDLRHLETFTIDSATTRDYDDALSLRRLTDNRYEVGVHIADVAAFIQPNDLVDREARARATSIYLPDQLIPMLPATLSEDLCSLRKGEDRLSLSFLAEIDDAGILSRTRITQSVIRIRERLTYDVFNTALEAKESFRILHQLGGKLRAKRLEQGAVMLPLPEIQVTVNPAGMIQVHRYVKETPSQIVVSEWMIAANQIAADYLADHKIPGIFRAQGECRPETQPVMSDHALFHVYRQRRLFARAELDTQPGPHCSLGVARYTSITSPIRRYVDLVTQRQLKHALATGGPLYNKEELNAIITEFRSFNSKVTFVQRKWTRYWLLKYIEQEDIQQTNALVLEKNPRFAHLLLTDFLLEANVPLVDETQVKPGELIRIRVDRVNPRDDVLRLRLSPRKAVGQ